MSTFLCLSSFFKGNEFLTACKKAGNTVYLVTSKKLDKKPWAREYIDEVFYLQSNENDDWNMDDLIAGTAYLMRSRKIDRIVALDDFDVEKAALLRETFRIPGMGQTTARHFRDKLAMRVQAKNAGILVPAFSALFNDAEINQFLEDVPAPWMIKPRGQASATGIEKCYTAEQVWDILDVLGHNRHNYLIEQFKPGDVYHVDAINDDRQVVMSQVSKYLATPHDVAHGGGIFRSITVDYDGEEDRQLRKLNADVMQAFGMNYSASHTEFICCHEDGKFYFLETASRVGGANLSDMVYHATGVQLWEEWANVEHFAALNKKYKAPKPKKMYSGIIISLSRHEKNSYDLFNAPEVKWRLGMDHHVGVVVASANKERVMELLDEYAEIVKTEFHASAPAASKPSH